MVAPDNLMESPMERSASKDKNSDLTNGNTTENAVQQVVIEEVHKQPSYVALACCISGYTTLSYDSKQRQGLRSRTVSPIRVEGVQNASYTSQCGNYLSPVPKEISTNMQAHGKGIDILNGCGGLHSPRRVANMALAQENRSYKTSMVKESYSSYNSATSRYSSYTGTNYSPNEKTNGSRLITPTNINEQLSPSSFIMQRVERLYGPGALAQGFYTSRKVNTNRQCPPPKAICEPSEASLPVLKLLRPEFRAQLSVANRKTRASTPDRYSSLDEGSSMDKKESDAVDATLLKESRPPPIKEAKDGHYYLKLHSEQVTLLENFADKTEKELETCDNEEASGILRAAAGKARLLVSQKLNQFKGLCKNNIEQSSGETFPTTDEDLAGFWDMVMIQVNEVLSQLDKITELKKNNWKHIEKKPDHARLSSRVTANARKMTKKVDVKDAPAVKARDEARKKLIEERRKALKENKDKMNSDVLLL